LIGYGLGSSWRHILTYFSYVGYVAVALAVLVIAGFVIHRLRQLRIERAQNS
jgi:Na+/H+ antiporter NhaC